MNFSLASIAKSSSTGECLHRKTVVTTDGKVRCQTCGKEAISERALSEPKFFTKEERTV